MTTPPHMEDEKARVDEILIGVRRKNPLKWAGIDFSDLGQAVLEALTAAESRGYARAISDAVEAAYFVDGQTADVDLDGLGDKIIAAIRSLKP